MKIKITNTSSKAATKPVDFTDEELEMFLNPTHKKTFKSNLLVKLFLFKLEARMFVAGVVGFFRQLFRQNDKTTSQSPVYVEDLLQREEFTLTELRAAKHKSPFTHWIKTQKFLLSDFAETSVLKLKLWLARF